MLTIREKDGTRLTISDCAPENKRLLIPNNLGRTEAGPRCRRTGFARL